MGTTGLIDEKMALSFFSLLSHITFGFDRAALKRVLSKAYAAF